MSKSIRDFLEVFGVLAVAGYVYYKTDSLFLGYLVASFVAVVVLVISIRQATRETDKKELLNLIASYDPQTSSIKLSGRSTELKPYLKATKSYDLSMAYEPEKLHIGAVSVGGVTTGGTYKTGGYDYISSIKHNGMYKIEFLVDKTNDIWHTVNTIQLSNALYEEAKNSSIAQYLNHEKKAIEVKCDVYHTQDEIKRAFDSKGYGSEWSKLANSGLPTREKAEKIIQWITIQ